MHAAVTPYPENGGHDRCCPGYTCIDSAVALLFALVPTKSWNAKLVMTLKLYVRNCGKLQRVVWNGGQCW